MQLSNPRKRVDLIFFNLFQSSNPGGQSGDSAGNLALGLHPIGKLIEYHEPEVILANCNTIVIVMKVFTKRRDVETKSLTARVLNPHPQSHGPPP